VSAGAQRWVPVPPDCPVSGYLVVLLCCGLVGVGSKSSFSLISEDEIKGTVCKEKGKVNVCVCVCVRERERKRERERERERESSSSSRSYSQGTVQSRQRES
jgi:hypothetical protein